MTLIVPTDIVDLAAEMLTQDRDSPNHALLRTQLQCIASFIAAALALADTGTAVGSNHD